MSVNAPSLPVNELRDRTVDLFEEGVSSATEVIAPLAERASKLRLDEELRSAAERVAREAEEAIDDFELSDATDRRALLALALLAAGLAVVLVVVARRRRADEERSEDED